MDKSVIKEIGPSKVIQLFFPVSNFHAIVVVDNTALGPSIGGVRVSRDVSVEEVKRLARTMTLKNSVSGLPHGGGKAGIIADPRDTKKEHYFRVFSQAIKDLYEYIPGPDMGSNEECMAWIYDEIGRSVGLPEEIGGLPLDKLGATGFGLSECAEIACPYAGIELKGARVAIQGFGSVGRAAARFLSEKGAIIVAASDTKGTICNPDGFDIKELLSIKEETGSVIHYKKGMVKTCEELFLTPCDVLIPAATADVISKENVEGVKAKLILQGANIPITREAEERLYKKGILSVPDFIANAGGVIMAAMEYAKKSEKEAFEAISNRIKKNTKLILEKTFKENIFPRQAAEELAKERVLNAMAYKKVL
ncbi:glutamate dehydrogenase [Dissulfurispira thermophila]|uniref:Glutamate dehydrogenase n=1 Tax=Dissulfurispira thermophila TaxID=2715679 RepID=A0A7G1H042_9BACT|nr:Glu/Leu/Phe/Val dehydrogenase [Dissulfurispira thermophila]BCB95639.1 glutamate dehydrogenase [Dissulfurispira thermophila]